MGDKIRVNTQSLDHTKQELEAKLNQIRVDMDKISQNMAAMNAMWTGEAHETFCKRVADDIHFLSEVCEGIQGIIGYEGNAVTEYNKCEQQVEDVIGQIRI